MANLLQSSASTATTAPDYYTNYLSNIATQGASAVDPTTGAQFVGAQPLQQQAFQDVSGAASAYQPTLNQASATLNNVGTSASPLASANPYLTAAGANPAMEAAQYMNPYTSSVANQLSNIGQRNIQQNLAPSATASAVGTGQYGSQRGAQVLGQTTANAENDLNTQIGQLLNTGYGTNLNAAVQQNQLQGQLGSTAASAESSGQQNLTNLGAQQSALAAQNQNLGLADINALSTLGGQQQTIAQNQQLFPLTNLSTLSSLLRGYNVPMSSTSTSNASPLSTLGGLVTGGASLFTPQYDKNGNPIANSTPFQNLVNGLGNASTTIGNAFGNNNSLGTSSILDPTGSGVTSSQEIALNGGNNSADLSAGEESGT
jgi:hypothetical protein